MKVSAFDPIQRENPMAFSIGHRLNEGMEAKIEHDLGPGCFNSLTVMPSSAAVPRFAFPAAM
jgi:hypothetical protein